MNAERRMIERKSEKYEWRKVQNFSFTNECSVTVLECLRARTHEVGSASMMQSCARPTDVRMLRGRRDVKALNIPRQRDVKLNDLAKQILMLLPLLLLLLLLLYVLTT